MLITHCWLKKINLKWYKHDKNNYVKLYLVNKDRKATKKLKQSFDGGETVEDLLLKNDL